MVGFCNWRNVYSVWYNYIETSFYKTIWNTFCNLEQTTKLTESTWLFLYTIQLSILTVFWLTILIYNVEQRFLVDYIDWRAISGLWYWTAIFSQMFVNNSKISKGSKQHVFFFTHNNCYTTLATANGAIQKCEWKIQTQSVVSRCATSHCLCFEARNTCCKTCHMLSPWQPC